MLTMGDKMFKTYDTISRFMDGIAVNYGAALVYLKDISGKGMIHARGLIT